MIIKNVNVTEEESIPKDASPTPLPMTVCYRNSSQHTNSYVCILNRNWNHKVTLSLGLFFFLRFCK